MKTRIEMIQESIKKIKWSLEYYEEQIVSKTLELEVLNQMLEQVKKDEQDGFVPPEEQREPSLLE